MTAVRLGENKFQRDFHREDNPAVFHGGLEGPAQDGTSPRGDGAIAKGGSPGNTCHREGRISRYQGSRSHRRVFTKISISFSNNLQPSRNIFHIISMLRLNDMRMRLLTVRGMEVAEQDNSQVGALQGARRHHSDDAQRRTRHFHRAVQRIPRNYRTHERVRCVGGGGSGAELRVGEESSLAYKLSAGGSAGSQRRGQ